MIDEQTRSEEAGKYEELRHLTDTYTTVQKLRIGNGNRVFASTEGLDTNEPDPFLSEMVEDLEALERKIFRQMKRVVKHHPAWPWMSGVKGIGPTLSTKVLGLIGDIGKFDTVSKLWAFSGYALKPGADGVPERQRPLKGEKLSYNRRLKTAVYLCGDSFIKSRSPYRDIYDEAKAYYRQHKQITPMLQILDLSHPDEELIVLRETPTGKAEWDKLIKEANKTAGAANDGAVWSDGHVDNAARRKMTKRFLAHLYLVWREAEGLPTREPYVQEYLGHTTMDDPWSFSS